MTRHYQWDVSIVGGKYILKNRYTDYHAFVPLDPPIDTQVVSSPAGRKWRIERAGKRGRYT